MRILHQVVLLATGAPKVASRVLGSVRSTTWGQKPASEGTTRQSCCRHGDVGKKVEETGRRRLFYEQWGAKGVHSRWKPFHPVETEQAGGKGRLVAGREYGGLGSTKPRQSLLSLACRIRWSLKMVAGVREDAQGGCSVCFWFPVYALP